jgi:hypothetical protein
VFLRHADLHQLNDVTIVLKDFKTK